MLYCVIFDTVMCIYIHEILSFPSLAVAKNCIVAIKRHWLAHSDEEVLLFFTMEPCIADPRNLSFYKFLSNLGSSFVLP